MNHAYAQVTLANPREPELQPLRSAHSRTAARFTSSSPSMWPSSSGWKRETSAKSRSPTVRGEICPYAGPIEIRFDGRRCYTGALILGEEVILGSVPMEDMDLVISPAQRTVTVNPDSPNIATSIAK